MAVAPPTISPAEYALTTAPVAAASLTTTAAATDHLRNIQSRTSYHENLSEEEIPLIDESFAGMKENLEHRSETSPSRSQALSTPYKVYYTARTTFLAA